MVLNMRLNKLNDIIDDIGITNINDPNQLDNIIRYTVNELNREDDIQDIELYDLPYRF